MNSAGANGCSRAQEALCRWRTQPDAAAMVVLPEARTRARAHELTAPLARYGGSLRQPVSFSVVCCAVGATPDSTEAESRPTALRGLKAHRSRGRHHSPVKPAAQARRCGRCPGEGPGDAARGAPVRPCDYRGNPSGIVTHTLASLFCGGNGPCRI